MFEEKQEYDVVCKATGHIEVCRSDIVLKNGIEIARNYNRYVIIPGDEVTNEVKIVRDIANAVWTEDLILAARIQNEFKPG